MVVNPQYLVDVMTCLHDISDHLNIDREHQSQWQTLQDHGVATIELLEYLWKDFKSPATELVAILEASGMLCPISSSTEDEDQEDGTKPVRGDENGPEIRKYIVPFHLKGKCLKGKWEKLCRKRWSGICTSDKVLMFDFHGFLPPALFHYFIVRTGSRSQSSNGMRPIIAKGMAIFSFGDSFFILTEMCQKHNQIRIKARYKNEKKLHELFYILKSIMTDICQRQFRFLKFRFGPTCPNPRCPGSSSEGTVLPVDTSSDESDNDDNDDAECGERESYVDSPTEGVRRHVICIDPAVASKPMWCNSTPVHEFEEIKQWLVKPQDAVSKVPEDSPCYSKPVEPCCLALVAKELAYKWKWLGRSLSVPDTVIETIQAENQSEEERAYQVLTRWSRKMGSVGTVHELMKAIQEVGDVPPLEAFDRHLGDRHVEAAKPY